MLLHSATELSFNIFKFLHILTLILQKMNDHCLLICCAGLSGVYNIVDHYEHEQMRAVEYVSTMHKAMNGVHNFPYYSPEHILNTFSQDKLERWDSHRLWSCSWIWCCVIVLVVDSPSAQSIPYLLDLFLVTRPVWSEMEWNGWRQENTKKTAFPSWLVDLLMCKHQTFTHHTSHLRHAFPNVNHYNGPKLW